MNSVLLCHEKHWRTMHTMYTYMKMENYVVKYRPSFFRQTSTARTMTCDLPRAFTRHRICFSMMEPVQEVKRTNKHDIRADKPIKNNIPRCTGNKKVRKMFKPLILLRQSLQKLTGHFYSLSWLKKV